MPAGECECLSLIPPTPGGTRRQGFFCAVMDARNRKRASLSSGVMCFACGERGSASTLFFRTTRKTRKFGTL